VETMGGDGEESSCGSRTRWTLHQLSWTLSCERVAVVDVAFRNKQLPHRLEVVEMMGGGGVESTVAIERWLASKIIGESSAGKERADVMAQSGNVRCTWSRGRKKITLNAKCSSRADV
jgi:hypothetical protein